MRIQRIDEPIKLSTAFYLIYAGFFSLLIFSAHPLSWDTPPWHKIICVLAVPFLASLAVYSIALFYASLTLRFREQRAAIVVFFVSITMAVIVLLSSELLGLQTPKRWVISLFWALAQLIFAFLARIRARRPS